MLEQTSSTSVSCPGMFKLLTRAFTVYVRPLLEYIVLVFGLHISRVRLIELNQCLIYLHVMIIFAVLQLSSDFYLPSRFE